MPDIEIDGQIAPLVQMNCVNITWQARYCLLRSERIMSAMVAGWLEIVGSVNGLTPHPSRCDGALIILNPD